LKAVNNAVDKASVPAADAAVRGSGRWLTACGLLALSLERQQSAVLSNERRKLFRMVEERPYLKRSVKGPLCINLRRTRRELAATIRRLRQIRALVYSDPGVAGGEPSFRGTGIPIGRAERDISGDLRGALVPVVSKNHAALTDPAEIGALLRAIDSYEGQPVTAAALKLAPLVFVRPGELRGARWAEFDLTAGEWRIPGERMKMGEQHIVPISRQAISILRDLQALTGRGECFPIVTVGDQADFEQHDQYGTATAWVLEGPDDGSWFSRRGQHSAQ
jgi:integrase